jgi:hypothetical protein
MMVVSLSFTPKGGACVGAGRAKVINWQIKKDPVAAESQN